MPFRRTLPLSNRDGNLPQTAPQQKRGWLLSLWAITVVNAQGNTSNIWALSDADVVVGEIIETYAGDFVNYVVWNSSTEEIYAVGTSFPALITTEAHHIWNKTIDSKCVEEFDGFTGQKLCMRQFQPKDFDFPTFDKRLHFTTQSFWYNPDGHVPVGTYSTEHVDFHFYMHVTREELNKIAPGNCSLLSPEAFYNATLPVPEECWPVPGPQSAWANVATTVPYMGNHVLNMAAPEFAWVANSTLKPNGFNATWIYGIYNGEVTFYEPMLTIEYLKTRPNECWATGTPRNSLRAGLYPTQWCIFTEEDTHYLELREFVYHKGGCGGPPSAFSFLSLPVNSNPLPPECKYARLQMVNAVTSSSTTSSAG